MTEKEQLDKLTQPMPTPGKEDVSQFILDELDKIAKKMGGMLTEDLQWVRDQIAARREHGIKKYGTSLMTWNGRDPLADAMEEELDRFQYLVQARKERADLIEERDDLRERLEYFEEEVEHSRAFKHYVHKRLDEAAVPHDPEPEKNKAHGCRVEGRLNWVFDQWFKAQAQADDNKRELDGAVQHAESLIAQRTTEREQTAMWKERAESAKAQADNFLGRERQAANYLSEAFREFSALAPILAARSLPEKETDRYQRCAKLLGAARSYLP